ncbi:MAG: hypothetical protein GX791_05085, partial [Synergistaceae bacterium]|nr:hypothetical protein [Synergistaceae bacterium]
MIRSMMRLSVWGVRSRRQEIISELFSLGVLHLDEMEGGFRGDDGTLNELRLLRGRVLGLVEALGWDQWDGLKDSDVDQAVQLFSDLPPEEFVPEISKSLEKFSTRLTNLQEGLARDEDTAAKLKKSLDLLSRFSAFFQRWSDSSRESFITLWWISPEKIAPFLAAVQNDLLSRGREDFGGIDHHFVPGREGPGILSLRVPQALASGISAIAVREKALPWRLPECCDQEAPAASIPSLKAFVDELEIHIHSIKSDLSENSEEWGPRLAGLFLFLDEKTEQAAVEARIETSDNFFVLSGWIPRDFLLATEDTLKTKFGKDILMKCRLPGKDEWKDVPTSLKNRPVFAPFEIFLKLLRPPSYTGFDPTTAVAVFFPFFSGIMIGDIGYGIIIFLLSLGLKRAKRPVLRDVGSILLIVSLWSVLWGAVWGEFFGDIGHRLFHLRPLWLERSEGVLPVMIFTIALGAAHVVLGLLIGIWQGIKNRHAHVWIEKSGNLIILGSLFGFLFLLMSEFPRGLFSIPVSFLVIGLALLIAGGGIGGIIEALGSIGNIISYVRIAAIGLSSAILALVASKFLDVFGLSILGVFLALMIHLLNFILAVAGSGLHSARLHYVEFFGKFYSDGGKNYTPFQRRSGSSWKK